MTPEQWKRLRELFNAAAPLDGDARAAYLARHCADDPKLAERLRRMLAAQGEDGVEQIVGEAAAAVGGTSDAHARIGCYRIVATLGEGGMGRVYLAERDDAHYRQKVAIKIIGYQAAGAQMLARFRAERQILANLQHPYIARLLDGGETEHGSPYLVMEYVEGRSITDYCSERDLPLHERLALFTKVCEAVEHAHRNLVIHRDIKPANILVTTDGIPKLLDFGIAKLTDDAAEGQTLALTRMDVLLLTPEYASPEQVSGAPVTTSTDVYGLGTLLYELLSGRAAYAGATRRERDWRRVICEMDPEPPSSAALGTGSPRNGSGDGAEEAPRLGATPRQRHGALRGDLDKIVLMAMRKEPARRYGSVRELREDLERYLAHLPVRARAASRGYLVGKFVRRHAVSLAAGAGVLVFLVGLTAAFNVRLGAERDDARRERDRAVAAEQAAQRDATTAERVSGFLVDLFEAADPSNAENAGLTTRQLLARAVERIDTELVGQPATQARLLSTLAQVHTNLDQFEEAGTLAHRALALAEGLAADEPQLLADALDVTAEVEWRLDHIENAVALGTRSLGIRREAGPESSTEIAHAMQMLATYVYYQDRYEECEELLLQAIAMQKRIGGDDLALASMLNALGVLYDELDREPEAVSAYRQGLAIRERILGAEHVQTAYARCNLAAALPLPEDAPEAEALARAALGVFEKAFGPEHVWVAQAAYTLAGTLKAQGKLDEAEHYARQAVAAAGPVDGRPTVWTATYLDTLTEILLARGDTTGAREAAERALAIVESRRDDDAWWLHAPLYRLALVELADRRPGRAVTLLERALPLAEAHADGTTIWTEQTLAALARAYTAEGHDAEARAAENRLAVLRAGSGAAAASR